MTRSTPLFFVLCGLLAMAPACASDPEGVAPASGAAVEVVVAEPPVDFHDLVQSFYDRISGRRFNSYATYQDPILRDYFADQRAYFDYYADLAQDLTDTYFEQSKPVEVRVEEIVVDGPGRARVRYRLVGENARPLRWWSTELIREDRWRREEGVWRIVPGKL